MFETHISTWNMCKKQPMKILEQNRQLCKNIGQARVKLNFIITNPDN